ncbi:DUF1801 domain-containing protein [Pinibacter soli]|uniref:DUF1801 domain-containing protein n=1 Tax=Pinibacter soli TaxID=3044211 RepID=A0ABT6RDE8_9BACT|nr:DUF1801 domain-containing protein [Pinibacter soli]MDI3320415.1 DUF1801 domain-containing protein [Pinibacter soli]
MDKAENIDAYIAAFPADVQSLLEKVRKTVQKAAPKAKEVISYGMPAFEQNGKLVYFAGYKNHIGFYPTSSGIANFQKEIQSFKNSKGAIQFPLDKPLPVDLITQIVKFRVAETDQKVALKKTAKKTTVKKTAEKNKVADKDFLSTLVAPARRALENNGITTLQMLAKYTEKEILTFHGMGPSTMPKLRTALAEKGLAFKE